jgi:hypothetical protein
VIALGAWLLVTVLSAEIWYRTHETGGTLDWSFEFPSKKDHFSDVGIPGALGDERRAASWIESDGSRWTAFFFKWKAAAEFQDAGSMPPSGALPAGGLL